MGRRHMISYCLVLSVLVLIGSGCEALKASKPIMPVRDYERMIAGRFDANYIGAANCLQACHFHDKVRRDFEASTMGAQMSAKSGLPVVDCESCHGPGSLAVEGITQEKVADDTMAGKQTECDYKTLIDLKELPTAAQTLICLKCHSANATFNIHNWNSSTHSQGDVSCSDCHRIHAGPDLIVRPRETFEMCYKCHEEVRAEFALPSHHPVPEKKLICTDCHDPHGGLSLNLRRNSVKETCVQCHAEKEGPFVFEHAENNEDCTGCHTTHGSVHNNLLREGEPFLCLQCHEGHRTQATTTLEIKARYYTRCTDCHSTIHGTDIPSASGVGRFTH